MGIEKRIGDYILNVAEDKETLSEKYDRIRRKKMESMYNGKFCGMLFSYLIFYRIFMK